MRVLLVPPAATAGTALPAFLLSSTWLLILTCEESVILICDESVIL